MRAYTYVSEGTFAMTDKPKPVLQDERDAIVRVTLAAICTSDLHIRRGCVPRAVQGVTVGHEMVGVVETVGSAVRNVQVGDRVAVNVETFCGECFFCRRGYVNNCSHPLGGWALGCRIDGGQAEFVRVPFADRGLDRIPDGVTDEQALFTGDLLSTGYWAADLAEIGEGDTVLVLGAGPAGICAALCALLRRPRHVLLSEPDPVRRAFVREHFPRLQAFPPEETAARLAQTAEHGGADAVIEAAGTDASFRAAWELARPNAAVVLLAMYESPQTLPLPQMYGKNLVFKTGGVDGCHCADILRHIAAGEPDASPLLTHVFALEEADRAYDVFEHRLGGAMKVALRP